MKPKIYYRLIDADPNDLQISVRFFSDLLPESDLVSARKPDGTPAAYRTDYAISLPVPVPAGDALHELIMRACPVDWFASMHAARDPNIDTSIPHIAVGMVREVAPPPRPEPTEAEQIAAYEVEVQLHMEGAARKRGYDSLMSAISYADEPQAPQFQAEGQAFRSWRSACWLKCHEVLNAYRAGERTKPTVAELLAELPPLGLEHSVPLILAA